MLLELRKYQIRPDKLAQYLENFETIALPIVSNYLDLVGCWTTDPGELSRFYHLWRWSSLDDRARRRAALYADPAWITHYLPVALPMIEHAESIILNPTAFSPELLSTPSPSFSNSNARTS